MNTDDLERKAKAAQAAYPTPWSVDPMMGLVVDGDVGNVVAEARDFPRCDVAEFIAAAHPGAVLSLIDAAREAQALRALIAYAATGHNVVIGPHSVSTHRAVSEIGKGVRVDVLAAFLAAAKTLEKTLEKTL